MAKIKGWTKVSDDNVGVRWTTAKIVGNNYDVSIGDIYSEIEVIYPNIRKKEIGYFYVTRKKVNWVSNNSHSSNPKEIFKKYLTQMNKREGIDYAIKYMRSHPNG